MSEPTNQEKLLSLLRTGRKFSKQDFLREASCWNSGDIVLKLRRAGHNIKTEWATNGDKRFAVYSLATK